MLTTREIQIARCISKGMYEKEIADLLRISSATVHAHSRNIRQKIGAGNLADITRYFIYHHDTAIRHRIRLAYQAGRAHHLVRGGDCQASDQPEKGFLLLRTRENRALAPAGVYQPCEARLEDLLLCEGPGSGVQNQHGLKAEILRWMYNNLAAEQFSKLRNITKQTYNYGRRNDEGRNSNLDVQRAVASKSGNTSANGEGDAQKSSKSGRRKKTLPTT